MSSPKVFVSSTCFDLAIVRSQLRSFVVSMGYEPMMSEHSDILFDPRVHTHTSCIQDMDGCDIVLLIIGSRFGGKAVPDAIQEIDFEGIKSTSLSTYMMDNRENLSITQLEICKAIELRIPMFTFVDEKVLHDHLVYEKNKDKAIIDDIGFPSIEKHETAKYIFGFINFIKQRIENNSITSFAKIEDIEFHLKRQWSALFQRMLYEQRIVHSERRRTDSLSEQLEDLKTAFMSSIATPDLRETARGAIRFRRMIDFARGLQVMDIRALLLSNISWDELLDKADIIDVRQYTDDGPFLSPRGALIRKDGTFYRSLYPFRTFERVKSDWDAFRQLKNESREAILDAIIEMSVPSTRSVLKLVLKPFTEVHPDAGSSKESKNGESVEGIEYPEVSIGTVGRHTVPPTN